jgi:UDP-GlcNAc:undecaprenyl-phosphate GlcNAc-1-phosphate transferase
MVTIAAAAFFMYAYRIWYGYGVEAAAPATLFAVLLMGMCLGFLPHNMHPARIFMGDSGSMLIGLVLAAGAVSITGQVDPDLMVQHTGSERSAVHAMVPLYMPLLLPLTIIAIPFADLVLAIVRRTWRGESPFAADKGHLHHRLLEIGHSHSRAVLIMYFWAALISFGAVAFSVQSSSLAIVLTIVVLSAAGLVVLLMPRFTPKVPRWAHAFVPPRYRGGAGGGETDVTDETKGTQAELDTPSNSETFMNNERNVQFSAGGNTSQMTSPGRLEKPEAALRPVFSGLDDASPASRNGQYRNGSSGSSCDNGHTK